MNHRGLAGLVVASLLAGGPVFPGGDRAPPPAASNDETKGFIGLNYVFGSGGQSVEGIIGIAHGEVESDGDVEGAKAALHLNLSDGIGLKKFKLTGLHGDEDAQGEFGVGWNVGTSEVFGVLGINADHAAAGADIGMGGIEGYLGVHTIGDFDPPPPAPIPDRD